MFVYKQKTAYEFEYGRVGSEMCIRDSLINELDADTPGSDTAEFIELFDGGAGGTPLTGLALVFFNGHDDRVYYAVDLSDLSTGPAGLVVAGGAAAAGHALPLPPGGGQSVL